MKHNGFEEITKLVKKEEKDVTERVSGRAWTGDLPRVRHYGNYTTETTYVKISPLPSTSSNHFTSLSHCIVEVEQLTNAAILPRVLRNRQNAGNCFSNSLKRNEWIMARVIFQRNGYKKEWKIPFRGGVDDDFLTRKCFFLLTILHGSYVSFFPGDLKGCVHLQNRRITMESIIDQLINHHNS